MPPKNLQDLIQLVKVLGVPALKAASPLIISLIVGALPAEVKIKDKQAFVKFLTEAFSALLDAIDTLEQ